MLKPLVLAALVAGTLVSLPSPALAASANVVIRIGPPAPREEAIPAPRRGYDWSPGYWNWNARQKQHAWVAGSWVN